MVASAKRKPRVAKEKALVLKISKKKQGSCSRFVSFSSNLTFPPDLMLLFKKKFLEPIRRGEKTQTIRLWKNRRMKAGQRSYIPGIGYISILSVDQVELERLTDADAVPDGFSSADLLREELFTLYADQIAQGHKAFRVCFSVLSEPEQLRMREEARERKKKTAREDYRQEEKERRGRFDDTMERLKRLAEPPEDDAGRR